jgi:hypothetical protein
MLESYRKANANRRNGLFWLVLLLVGSGFAPSSEARSKTDRVTLINGDTISGEIKVLENGYLSLSTTKMGTVRIEWDGISSLDSDYFFRVRTVSGVRYFGAIDESAAPGRLAILHAEGAEEYPIADVVSIKPVDSSLSDRLDIRLSAGYSEYRASDSSTTRLGMNIGYEDELSTNNFEVRSVVTDASGETNTNNRVDLVRLRLWQNPFYFNYYGALWESNDQLAIDSRFGLAYGIGRRLVDSNRTKFYVSLGLQGVAEEDSIGESTESLEGLVAIQYDVWRFSNPELSLESSLRLFPGITETGRYRADGDITLSWEVIDDLNINLSAFGNLDSKSNEEGDDYDYGITTGIEWAL